MNQPPFMELDLPEATEWKPDNDAGTPEENDRWMFREQAARWKSGDDRNATWPSPEMFKVL